MSLMAFWMKWHRRVGLFIAPVILMLAVTGILINHSQQLGWFEQPVYSKAIGLLYGVKPEPIVSGFPILPLQSDSLSAPRQWAIQSGDQLLLDTLPVGHCSGALKGALTWDSMLAFLCGNELLFFTQAGELVEQMFDLPDAHYLGISEATGRLVISSRLRRESSDHPAPDCSRAVCHYLNPDLWQWQAASSSDSSAVDSGLRWSSARQLPERLSAPLNRQRPLPGISLERVLLDLHSGRLFGNLGILIVDLAGLLMILLVLSGAGTWSMRTLRKGRSKQTRRKENQRQG